MNDNLFCDQPWRFKIVNLSQNWFKFCCVGPEISNGQSLANLESNTFLINVKEELFNNIKTPACNYCWRLEERGSGSFRTIKANTDKTALAPGLAVIEINLENTCQLRCAMCGPKYSSRWKNQKIFEIVDDEKIIENVNHTIKLIHDNKDTLQRIFITGGEPSIIPNFYRIIDTVSKELPSSCWIFINTNGMFNERLGDKFISTIKRLNKTHNIMLYWSCDAYGEVGEFLRDGLDYEHFKSNLKTVMQETSVKNTIQITTTHMNIKSQIDLIEDIRNTVGDIPFKKLFPVTGKDFMHPSIIGNNIKDIVTDSDLNRIQQLDPEYAIEYIKLIKQISLIEPNITLINKSKNWFNEYELSLEKKMPEYLKLQFEKYN